MLDLISVRIYVALEMALNVEGGESAPSFLPLLSARAVWSAASFSPVFPRCCKHLVESSGA